MHLSHDALDVGYAIRELVGADVKGVGPDTAGLVALPRIVGKSGVDIRAALDELESYGLIRISYCIGLPRPGIHNELRDIAGVSILEPLQQMFDEWKI